MSEPIVIQCPTCSKKFKLPAKPPATFTCTQCQTPMDLSAFREAAAATKPTKQEVTGGLEGARSSRLAGRGARARLRRSRDGGDEEGGEGGALPPKKDNSQALVIGSLVGLVVIGGIALVVLKKKKPADEPAPVAKTAPAVDEGLPMGGTPGATPPAAMGSAPAAGTPAAGPTPSAPSAGASTDGSAPAAPSAPSAPATPPAAKGTIHEVGHHPDATPEEQAQIDQLVQKAVFESGGADSRDAGKALVALGYKAAPRLINVFHTVKSGEGFDDINGRMKAGVADGLLRKIDGFQERSRRNKSQIKATSDAKFAESTAKGWVLWWDTGVWKEKPQKPWDERIDGAEEEARKNGESGDK